MATVTLNVSERVLKRATEIAEIAGVSLDRLLEELLNGSIPEEFSEEKLSPGVRSMLGLMKTSRSQKSVDDLRYEALREKYG
jgi:hypothetical protein